MPNLRSKIIRLAASMPKGSPERLAILNVLAGNPVQVLWNMLVRDGIRLVKKGGSGSLVIQAGSDNMDRLGGLMKRAGWKAVGPGWDFPYEFSHVGGFHAAITRGSRPGLTHITLTGPKLQVNTKTPPKLTAVLRDIMRIGWRGQGTLTKSEVFDVVGPKNWSKVDKLLKKLVGYGYLDIEGDHYRVTEAGQSAS